MHPRRRCVLPATLTVLTIVGGIVSQVASDSSLSTAPPPISADDLGSGLDSTSPINTEDESFTDLSSDITSSTDDKQSTGIDHTNTAASMTTTDSEVTSVTTHMTSASPSTFLTSTSSTPNGLATSSSSQPGWQTNTSHASSASKDTIAPGGYIAISLLLALMVGAGGYILWRAFRSRRRVRVLEGETVDKDNIPSTSFAPSDHSAAIPLFTESARSSGEAFSPTAANALPGSARFPMEYDKPLPAPPNQSAKHLQRLFTKGKRPVYNTAVRKISTSQSARPSPLRRQFSFDLEDEANNEVLRSAGLTPPASAVSTINRSGPLTSNPVDNAEIQRLSTVSADTGSPRSSLDSLPESLRVRPGSI